MNLLAAFLIGVVLGALSLAGLWLTIQHALRGARPASWLVSSQVLRTLGCALLFTMLVQNGLGTAVSALGGFWIIRWRLIARLGASTHGE